MRLFNILAKFKKTKTSGDSGTRIVAVPDGGKKRHILKDFNIFIFLQLFQFFCEFRITQGSGDSGTTFRAVPEAAKSDTSYRILILLFCASFSIFLRISKNTR